MLLVKISKGKQIIIGDTKFSEMTWGKHFTSLSVLNIKFCMDLCDGIFLAKGSITFIGFSVSSDLKKVMKDC